MTAPECSRPLPVRRVGPAGLEQVVEASEAECRAIAARLAIPAVLSLRCRFLLRPDRGGAIAAEGELAAVVTRDCVVSAEPFDQQVNDRFRVRFVPAMDEDDDEDALFDPDSDDEIPYANEAIDLGEAAVEQLALALDPYPRKPGAELPGGGEGGPAGPFDALARLKRPS